MSENYTGRLAPSPTGFLHLGHAATFAVAHRRAREMHGQLLLRIDDLDAQRSRAEYAEAAREDLTWLGLSWDGEVRQSERLDLYLRALQNLLSSGSVYPCKCSRRDLQEAVQAPHEDSDEPVYNGRCRPCGATVLPEFVVQTNYRFRVPDGEIISFTDLQQGPQTFVCGRDFGDFLVWRKDGLPSYQLACVVDDAETGITEVVRGRDLLKSTGRQILLQRALQLPSPRYLHTDLLRDQRGERLAKRDHALSLRTLRESGVTPEELRARVEDVAHHKIQELNHERPLNHNDRPHSWSSACRRMQEDC